MDARRLSGFTLIEMMVTLGIAIILISVGTPALQDMITNQGVRAASSGLMTDMSYARADAISNQRRVAVVRLDSEWQKGWRVLACLQTPACAACTDPTTGTAACLDEPIHRPALGGRIKICTRMNSSAVDTAALIFNPDGRVMDTAAAGADLHINNIMVSDDMGDADSANDKLRALEFGPTGRVSLHDVASSGGTVCP